MWKLLKIWGSEEVPDLQLSQSSLLPWRLCHAQETPVLRTGEAVRIPSAVNRGQRAALA